MPKKPERVVKSLERVPVADDAVIDVHDLEVHFRLGGGLLGRLLGLGTKTVRAVDGIDLTLHKGEVLGLVGESGSGKTTLGRALLGMAPATKGQINYHDPVHGIRRVSHMPARELRELRTDVQMVFQDPHAALNPTMTIETAVGHPLVIHGAAKGEELRRRVAETLEKVGLSPAEQFMEKYPSDLSGGQKQRAVIARAIIMGPEVLVADEPVSMLDMSVRAKILQLMIDLQHELGLTYVYITHDLASAKYFCDRIAIMYLGRIVEVGSTEEVFANPRHPYTRALLKAIPEPDPQLAVPRDLPRGEIPDAARPPLGCSFHPRCPVATSTCGWESRDLKIALEEHWLREADAAIPQADKRVLGKLDALDEPSQQVSLGKGRAAEAKALLERIRDENPEEPMWTGVDSMEVTDAGVEVRFHESEDPRLRRDGSVDVACVLYPGESTTSPAGSSEGAGT